MKKRGLNYQSYVQSAPIYSRGKAAQDIQAGLNQTDIVKMSSNENPLGPSPAVITAVKNAVDSLNFYPDPDGEPSLIQALADLHGKGLTTQHINLTNSGVDGLNLVALAFLQVGDEVIICEPTFLFFRIAANRVGAKIVQVDLDPDTFAYDVDAILAAITDKTRVIYVVNPNNPTGTIMPASDMNRLVNNLPDDVILLSDEVYFHFVTDPDYPDTTPYIHAGKNVIQLFSFSKAYGMAGMRLGYMIARPEITDYIGRLRGPFYINRLSLAAGMAALGDMSHIEETIDLAVKGRKQLLDGLTNLGVQAWPSQTNFVLFTSDKMAAPEIVDHLMQKGIILRVAFGYERCARVTVGLPEHNTRFLQALAEILP